MARFNNNMFQDGYEDVDTTGIMNAVNLRKDANTAKAESNDQYTADVADYKDNEATAAEQGVASLPEATNNQFTNNSFANTKFPIGPNGEPMFVGEDIDYTGMGGSPINTTYTEPNVPFVPVSTNPYTNVLASIPGEPEPVYDPYIAEESVYVPPVETVAPVNTGLPEAEDSVTYVPPVETVAPVYQTPTANSIDDTSIYIPPSTNSSSPAIGDIDSETGLVWDGGTFVRPESWNGTMVNDDYIWDGRDWVFDIEISKAVVGLGMPNADGSYPDGTGGGSGPQGTTGPTRPMTPAPTPAPVINYYTGLEVQNPYQVFEQPTTPSSYTRPMTADVFGGSPGIATAPLATYAGLDSTSYDAPTAPQLAASLAPFLPPEDDTATTPPGMNQGGRVPMGNNNTLNSGLSRLPINQQNDTLTQVFQSGFRPRR